MCSGTTRLSMPMAGRARGLLVSKKLVLRCAYTVIYIREANGRAVFKESFAAYATTVLRPMPWVSDHFELTRDSSKSNLRLTAALRDHIRIATAIIEWEGKYQFSKTPKAVFPKSSSLIALGECVTVR